MDLYSSKRSCGWISALRKGSTPSTKHISDSKDEAAEFCNRIGCSGRLKHTKHARNNNLERPKPTKPSTNKKKPSNSRSSSDESEVEERKLKSKSVDAESSNAKTRKMNGLKDAQVGSNESGRRINTVKRRSTEGETSGVSSVRTRRSVNLRGNDRSVNPEMSQTEISRFSAETSGGTSLSMIPRDQSIANFTDALQFNVDSIANVLLALERIDQDEELTYEQIMSMEGNSLLGGFNLYDQHRDMRLDIDNMSYEELLALEEKMGIVSTALSEEELAKCIRISLYQQPLNMKETRLDDTKCSVCQEEFVRGDEIGRIKCDHGFHATCINHWLQLKNWCPICKSCAN